MVESDIAKEMRNAKIAITGETLALREEGIENYLENELEDETAVELVKLYYTGTCNDNVLEEFVGAFNETDKTFSDDLTNEIQVLAGIVLCEVILKKEYPNTISLIEIYASMYNFLGYKSISNGIYCLMVNDFDERRSMLRENIAYEKNRIMPLESSVDFAEEEAEYDEGVIEKLQSIVKKVNEIANTISITSEAQTSYLRILHEDSQMLWWLLTGRADILEQRYSEMDGKKAAILAGTDLAKRVQIFPGPYAAKRLLSKVFEVDYEKDEIPFEDYIETLDEKSINSIVGNEEIDTPILFALKKKADNGSGCWKNAFLKKFVKTKSGYTLIEIAYEIYLECLAHSQI